MSTVQLDKIDIIGIDKKTGEAVLTISDHLDWKDVEGHLLILQEKINTYLRFCESGEVFDSYPDALNRRITFQIVGKYRLPEEGSLFIEDARKIVQKAGFSLSFCQFQSSN